MVRRLVFVLALAACSHGKGHGPAWPQPSTTADDGGESISPHQSSKVAAAIEKAVDEDKPVLPAVTMPAATPAGETAPATVPPAPQPTVEDIFINEEITIEIDD